MAHRLFMWQELIENLNKGELPKNEYSCMNEQNSAKKESSQSGSVRSNPAPVAPERKATPHSMRSRRTAAWARPRSSDDGYSRYFRISF